MDHELIAAELMRALRGDRSQEAFGRRLRCRANTIYTWESGRNFPTAARMFAAAERSGVDVEAALVRFYARRPAWLDGDEQVAACNPCSAEGVRRLLEDLRGTTTTVALAARVGRTRFAVARWRSASRAQIFPASSICNAPTSERCVPSSPLPSPPKSSCWPTCTSSS